MESAEVLFCSLYLLYNGYDPGVTLNSKTSFEDHINHVIKVCCIHLCNLARLTATIIRSLAENQCHAVSTLI